MKRKKRIIVITGGKSSEHDVSIMSGKEIVKQIDKDKYDVSSIILSKTGRGLEKILNSKADVYFIAIHGQYGEDGTIQGLLELSGIPYTGSKVLASAIGMDKEIFRRLMKLEGFAIPRYIALHKKDSILNLTKILGKMPYFVKPVNGGSSIGASIARNTAELKNAINLAFKYDNEVLVDEYIKGSEVTCAIIGNSKPIALPIVQINPLKGKFFDYESKYTESGSDEIVPAKISKSLTKKIQQISIEVYKTVGCRGFARVDFILKNNRTPIILEINTIPGLTPMSLFPKAAKAAGISYSQLIDKIIKYAKE